MNALLINKLEKLTAGSAWRKGVKAYALELVDGAEVELTGDNALYELLNGADNWWDYSWGGSAYIYEGDIVEQLCTPSEIKRFESGKLSRPNDHEEWMYTQARALHQAYNLIRSQL